jgi:hypothetical protein
MAAAGRVMTEKPLAAGQGGQGSFLQKLFWRGYEDGEGCSLARAGAEW